jgi:hypothetical protein
VDYFGLILLATIGVMIVASIWLTSERYSNRYLQDDNNSYQPKPPGQENIDGRTSPDFRALINAVHYEGRANRKEENREDNGKSLRDIVTISILFLTFIALAATCVAIIWQVNDARDAVVISQRAWIDPLFVRISPPIVVGNPLVYRVSYQNVGHSPATALTWAFDNGFRPVQKPNAYARFDAGPNSTCNGLTPDDKDGSVEFPPPQSVPPSEYLPNFAPGRSNSPKVKHPVVADEDMLNGNHLYYIQGCFVYRTMNLVGKSRFCFFLQKDGDSYSLSGCGDNIAE